jgi:hypothetical protein
MCASILRQETCGGEEEARPGEGTAPFAARAPPQGLGARPLQRAPPRQQLLPHHQRGYRCELSSKGLKSLYGSLAAPGCGQSRQVLCGTFLKKKDSNGTYNPSHSFWAVLLRDFSTANRQIPPVSSYGPNLDLLSRRRAGAKWGVVW